MREDYKRVMARLHKFQLLHRLRIQQSMDGQGLHYGQMPLMDYVEKHEGCTQREAAAATFVSEPAVATSVKRMQKAGLIVKTADSENLRRNRLALTKKGADFLAALRRNYDELDSRIFDSFTDSELETLCSMLDRMTSVISGEEERGIEPGVIGRLAGKLISMEKHSKQVGEE